jgi:hypothetical protein
MRVSSVKKDNDKAPNIINDHYHGYKFKQIINLLNISMLYT